MHSYETLCEDKTSNTTLNRKLQWLGNSYNAQLNYHMPRRLTSKAVLRTSSSSPSRAASSRSAKGSKLTRWGFLAEPWVLRLPFLAAHLDQASSAGGEPSLSSGLCSSVANGVQRQLLKLGTDDGETAPRITGNRGHRSLPFATVDRHVQCRQAHAFCHPFHLAAGPMHTL